LPTKRATAPRVPGRGEKAAAHKAGNSFDAHHPHAAITRPRLAANIMARQRKETLMAIQHLLTQHPGVMSDPQWIALESIGEQTQRFVFDDAMLRILESLGLVEPAGEHWQITERGQRTLHERSA
jgi:hypothetical protein